MSVNVTTPFTRLSAQVLTVLTTTQIRARGWTPRLISSLLTPHFRPGRGVWFSADEVVEVEGREGFAALLAAESPGATPCADPITVSEVLDFDPVRNGVPVSMTPEIWDGIVAGRLGLYAADGGLIEVRVT